MLLAMLGTVAFGVALYAANALKSADTVYSTLVRVELPNNTRLARVNRQAFQMVYAGYRALAYDGASAEAKAATSDETDRYRDAADGLAAIAKAEPNVATTLNTFKDKLDRLHALTSEGVRLGAANRNDEAKVVLAKADIQIHDFAETLRAFNDERIKRSTAVADGLTAQAQSTATMLIATTVAGLLGAIAIALFVSISQITRPISRLQDTMGKLASGQTAVEVPGTEKIAVDNQAQSVAVTQISSAVGTMDRTTQQNAAMVEQTSAAARNLHNEVTALAERASRFKTGGRAAQTGAAQAARPKPSAPRAAPASLAQIKSVATEEWASF